MFFEKNLAFLFSMLYNIVKKGCDLMIRSNLAVLLAETNLKIARVSHDTGISRTTLTALSQNYCKGIQFDTLNTLCSYLNVTPSELIQYYPVDIVNMTLDIEGFDDYLPFIKGTLYFDLYQHGAKHTCCYAITCHPDSLSIDGKSDLMLFDITISDTAENTNKDITTNILKKIPRSFLKDIEKEIALLMYDHFHFAGTENTKNDTDWSIKWDIFN